MIAVKIENQNSKLFHNRLVDERTCSILIQYSFSCFNNDGGELLNIKI